MGTLSCCHLGVGQVTPNVLAVESGRASLHGSLAEVVTAVEVQLHVQQTPVTAELVIGFFFTRNKN